MRAFKRLFLALFAAKASASYAGACLTLRENASGLYGKAPATAEVFRDSLVEVETEMRDEVMMMLTTTDGTIGPLLNHATQKFPRAIVDLAVEKGLTAATADKLAWDDLSVAQKLGLLRELSASRGVTFSADRAIRGIKIRPLLTLRFDQPTTFLGTKYEAGTHLVNVSRFLGGKVEYLSQLDVDSVGGVEFHFRGPESAGTMSADLRVLQRALDLPSTHQHVHMVTRKWVGEPRTEAAIIGDHFRRANLTAEMQSIVEEGASIDRVTSDKGAVFFDSLPQASLAGVIDYLESAIGNPNPPKIGDRFKLGYVGFRGVDFYDEAGLIGYEYRAIDAESRVDSISPILDAMQHFLTRGNTPEALAAHARWVKHYGVQAARFHQLAVVQSALELLKSGPPEVLTLVDAKFRDSLETKDQTKNQEIKMLFHSWANDSLLFENPKLQQVALARQKEAVAALKAGAEPNEAVRKFLKDSGLYDLFRKPLSGT